MSESVLEENGVFQKTWLFEYGGGQCVVDIAHQCLGDKFLCRIRDQDLFSCEARYHSSCCKKYTTEPRLKSPDQGSIVRQEGLEKYHNQWLIHGLLVDLVSDMILCPKLAAILDFEHWIDEQHFLKWIYLICDPHKHIFRSKVCEIMIIRIWVRKFLFSMFRHTFHAAILKNAHSMPITDTETR